MTLVDVDYHEGVATLTLNRPEARNALSVELCDSIVAALEAIEGLDARVVIIRGAGSVFCSGADFAAVAGPSGVSFLPAFERMLEAVAGFRLPTIAVIHGAALGGGLQLATVCDFRIAASDAKLGIPSSRLGIVVNFENVQRLVLLAGIARAKEVLMTARTFTGTEAATAGLVNAAVAPADLESEATALANEIAALAPLSVQGAKKAVLVVTGHLGSTRTSRPGDAAAIDALVAQAYASSDLAEGLRAMSEKRRPKFTGG